MKERRREGKTNRATGIERKREKRIERKREK